ncbi:restriction endonuclease subunit S [Lysinibacillus sp. NPDC098008]|uniref:restriction endonuclease subunit S n=1 Tax=Lysinibacillus sp. NPDC098008 TaxID=3364146 RepID=UPI00382F8D24
MGEVREGYKMTELGEIPSEWDYNQLSKYVAIKSGIAPSKLEDINELGEYPYYKVDDMNYASKYLIKAKNNFDNCQDYKLLKVNSIIFPKRGASIFTNKIAITTQLCMIDTNLMVLEVNDSNQLDYEYLYYNLLAKELSKIADTSSIPQINNKHIENIKILVPLIEEQQKIASILSTVDEQIDETEQLIVKIKELKKGLMQQLLTKGIGHTEFKQTELGEIPAEWDLYKFENLVEAIDGDRGKNYPSEEDFSQTGYCLFLSAQNMTKSGFNFKVAKYISKEKHELLRSGVVRKGDLILTSRGSKLGRIALFEDEKNYPVVRINSSMLILRKKNVDFIGKYLVYFLHGIFLPEYLKKAKVGSAQPHITKKDLNNQSIILPTLEEQQKIAQILSTVDEQIEVYEQEKAKYEELKKGLMQQLLTGQIRVKI